MVNRVDDRVAPARKHVGQRRAVREVNTVPMLIVVLVDVRAGSRHVGGNVLVQGAAERHVDQLATAAHPKHRLARFDELMQQFELVHVAHTITRPLVARRLLRIRLRRDVRAALQQQTVEMLRIVAQTDIARVQHALMADRRNHEHQDITRHDPVRNRFLEVLQRLAPQPLRAWLRVEDARRHADTQRALRDPLAGAIEQLTRPRRNDAAEHGPRRIVLLQIARRRRGQRVRRRRIRCSEVRRGTESRRRRAGRSGGGFLRFFC